MMHRLANVCRRLANRCSQNCGLVGNMRPYCSFGAGSYRSVVASGKRCIGSSRSCRYLPHEDHGLGDSVTVGSGSAVSGYRTVVNNRMKVDALQAVWVEARRLSCRCTRPIAVS